MQKAPSAGSPSPIPLREVLRLPPATNAAQAVSSTTGAAGAFFFTDSIPFSRAASLL